MADQEATQGGLLWRRVDQDNKITLCGRYMLNVCRSPNTPRPFSVWDVSKPITRDNFREPAIGYYPDENQAKHAANLHYSAANLHKSAQDPQKKVMNENHSQQKTGGNDDSTV